MSEDPKHRGGSGERASPAEAGATAPKRPGEAELEGRFFADRVTGGTPSGPAAPPRRESPLLARSPIFAVVALGLCGWLLAGLWPDVAYFFSSSSPIDLGGPATFHLDRAAPNRLCRIQGGPAASVAGVRARSSEQRRIIGLFGANLLVDRPGGAGPAVVYQGRLLPQPKVGEYEPFLAPLRERGFAARGGLLVLRDGERPRTQWKQLGLTLVLLFIAGVNLRALLKRLF